MRRLVLLMWLPMLVLLYPLPPQVADTVFGGEEVMQTAGCGQADAHESFCAGVLPPKIHEMRQVYVNSLWWNWAFTLGVILGGLLVGVVAWCARPGWQIWVAAWGVLVIAMVLMRYTGSHPHVPERWLYFSSSSEALRLLQANWRLAMSAIDIGQFSTAFRVLYREFVLPLLEGVVMAWLLVRYRKKLFDWLGAW